MRAQNLNKSLIIIGPYCATVAYQKVVLIAGGKYKNINMVPCGVMLQKISR